MGYVPSMTILISHFKTTFLKEEEMVGMGFGKRVNWIKSCSPVEIFLVLLYLLINNSLS